MTELEYDAYNQFFVLSLVSFIFLGMGVHYAVRAAIYVYKYAKRKLEEKSINIVPISQDFEGGLMI